MTALLMSLVVANGAEEQLRLGFFPNITHAQALIGVADGTFQAELGPAVRLEPRVFSAGPALIDAIFAGHQVLIYKRPVDPRQHVVVQRVHLAERRAHLADLRQQAAGQ